MSYFNLTAFAAPMATKEGLTHAMLQSVLNHASATENDRARMGNTERGGCWSDAFIRGVGSRDWTLKREKSTVQTLGLIKRSYEDALAWFVDEKHVKAITIDVVKLSTGVFRRNVMVTLNDGVKFEVQL